MNIQNGALREVGRKSFNWLRHLIVFDSYRSSRLEMYHVGPSGSFFLMTNRHVLETFKVLAIHL